MFSTPCVPSQLARVPGGSERVPGGSECVPGGSMRVPGGSEPALGMYCARKGTTRWIVPFLACIYL
jgi:hypothetical protein